MTSKSPTDDVYYVLAVVLDYDQAAMNGCVYAGGSVFQTSSTVRLRGTLNLCTCLARFTTCVAFAMALSGCAVAPVEQAVERLDETTGTTVTVMPRPVELVIEQPRGPNTNHFASFAPFETNQMGTHELFLWVSAPQMDEGDVKVTQVYCGDAVIDLEAIDADMKRIGLSKPPYKMPVPWSRQWFFKLSSEALNCFAQAGHIKIVTQGSAPESDSFLAESPALTGLNAFATRLRTD